MQETLGPIQSRTHWEVRLTVRLLGHQKVCEQVKGPAHSRLGQGGKTSRHSTVRIFNCPNAEPAVK